MLKVHNEGRATVSSGTREEMERDVQRLHEYGLWATLQRDDEFWFINLVEFVSCLLYTSDAADE